MTRASQTQIGTQIQFARRAAGYTTAAAAVRHTTLGISAQRLREIETTGQGLSKHRSALPRKGKTSYSPTGFLTSQIQNYTQETTR